MSIASNYIGLISSAQFGGKETNISNPYQLDDDTFSEILNKQLQAAETKKDDWLSLMGFKPIEEASGINIQDLVSLSKQQKYLTNDYNASEKDITTSELLTFLSSPFDTHNKMNQSNHGFMDFAKKQAANFYNKCASNVVTDLTEFVTDTLNL